jgi:predicted DsbA family dithiol-disulfide isomerase
MDVSPGTIVIWSDIGCPWAHLAVHRLHETRRRLGLLDAVVLEHRPFPLELLNERVTPRRVLAAEVPVAGALAPEAGWQEWDAPEWEWPVTTLPALEAVQAASAQDGRAAEELDRALRIAFLGDSRCISMRHVILEVASKCEVIDFDALAGALDDGVARRAVMARFEQAERSDEIKGSPHLFLPDGSSDHNPGIEMHWEGRPGEGFPVVDRDDPEIYDELLRLAAG